LIWEVGTDLQVGTEVGEGWIDLGSRVDLLSWYDLWISLLTLKSFQITRKSTRELLQKVGPDYSNCIFKLNSMSFFKLSWLDNLWRDKGGFRISLRGGGDNGLPLCREIFHLFVFLLIVLI